MKVSVLEDFIPLTKPYISGNEIQYISDAISNLDLVGDGSNTKIVESIISTLSGNTRALLTPSCTQALDMCAILLDLQPGDEVIVPGFTFTSTAAAFALQRAKIVFADINPVTLNINEQHIEQLVNQNTKAISVLHYAGVSCEMDQILKIAHKHGLKIIEDAAHSFGGKFKTQTLGSVGDMGTLSFHVTKNIHCGEGGAFLTTDEDIANRACVIREKGTNRKSFLNGEIDKYTWIDHGSSFLAPDISAAFLRAQLEQFDFIQQKRAHVWNRYHEELRDWAYEVKIKIPTVPEYATHTSHLFWLTTQEPSQRNDLLSYLNKHGIGATFHYQSLASSPAGKRFGRSDGTPIADLTADTIIRLPLWPEMTDAHIDRVINTIKKWKF